MNKNNTVTFTLLVICRCNKKAQIKTDYDQNDCKAENQGTNLLASR